jgi:copper ion binding protein
VKAECTQAVKAECTQAVKAECTQAVKAECTQAVKAECTEAVKAECTQAVKAECTEAVKAECTQAVKAACPASNGASAKLQQVVFKVDGLNCPTSSEKLDVALTNIDGVSSKSLCAQSKTAKVAFDEGKLCKTQVEAAIKQAGYKVQGEQISLKVNGMSCGACSSKLNAALGKVDGVKDSAVCLESKTARVLVDGKKVSRDQLVSAITRTGYSVEQEAQ